MISPQGLFLGKIKKGLIQFQAQSPPLRRFLTRCPPSRTHWRNLSPFFEKILFRRPAGFPPFSGCRGYAGVPAPPAPMLAEPREQHGAVRVRFPGR